MPIVRVNIFEGRSLEKKRQIIKGITQVIADACEVPAEGIHVLIEEMTKENWGRGGIPNIDRAKGEHNKIGFFSVSTVRVGEGNIERYLAYRKEHVNPGMAAMFGFGDSILAQEIADPNNVVLFNGWGIERDWRDYQRTRAHDGFRDTIRGTAGGQGLTDQMDIKRYVPVDLPHGHGLDVAPTESRYMSISTHSVRPGRAPAYLELRRHVVNPGMAALDGFLSATILQDLDNPNDHLIVNQWTSEAAAKAYSTGNLHDEFRAEVRALLTQHSGTRYYNTVVL